MILIIANARIKGGLSGSDNIYLNLAKYGRDICIQEMTDVDFRPFWLCYAVKIICGTWRALWDNRKYEFVYSASDFWMDSLPAFIYKLKGRKWVASFYLFAPKENFLYYWTQKPIIGLINRFADVVCVTNESMFRFDRPMVAVHGGVDLKLAYPDDKTEKIYDAVFVGRLHYTKGIRELTDIWEKVLRVKPRAQLAVIGAGDSEEAFFKEWYEKHRNNVQWYGYMADERFDVYRKSKMVLYTTPYKYSHFSMGPVEAMACGCSLVAFDIAVMDTIKPKGAELCRNSYYFTRAVVRGVEKSREAAEWARTWDWSVRAPKILKEIRGML